MIRLEAVRKEFPGPTVAVERLDLEIAGGQTWVLLGPSGCGKTTTLRMINRLIEPTSGRILLDEEDVTHIDPVLLRLRMGYVIQQAGLFPHMTVADNVGTVPRLLEWDRARVRARVDELLELVGLPPADFRRRYPHQLSGGQQQRVGFARALGADPPVLLMDEPFGAVDRITRDRLQNEFIRIQRDMRKTVVFVTHDIDEAVKVGDRIVIMSEQARVEQVDAPADILGRPATPFVAEFLGRDRLLKRLAVTRIDPLSLEARPEPAQGTTEGAAKGGRRVALGAPVSEALEALLEAEDGWVPVYEGDRFAGAFTAGSLQASVRSAPGRE